MDTYKFDPAIFINPPYIMCPKCEKEGYGILMVRSDSYLRRCKYCFYPKGHEKADAYDLPLLKKKSIYLDQFAISEMAKAKIDSKGRERWTSLHNILDSMVLNQLTVCPDSRYHEEETELFRSLRKEIKDFYIQMSRGATFKTSHSIEVRQISQALKKFVGEDSDQQYLFPWKDAFNNDPSSWHEHYQIRVNKRLDETEVEKRRIQKEKHAETMSKHLEGLPDRKSFDFDNEVKIWNDATANSILILYDRYVKEQIAMTLGLKPFDPSFYMYAPTVIDIAEYVISFFKRRGIESREDLISKVQEFFYSESFGKVPYVNISSLFSAGISRKYVFGARKGTNVGNYYDKQIVSHLLPYCDAMFIDNEARSILTERPVDIENKYNIKLFSLSNLDDFLVFLKKINDSADRNIKASVAAVYGQWHEVNL